MVPVRAMPWVTRRARAVHWCGSSDASVATMPITAPPAAGVAAGGRPPDGQARRRQLLPGAEVGLEEHPDGVAGPAVAHHPRGGAVAAFELVADHSGAAAHRAFLDRPAARRLQRVD